MIALGGVVGDITEFAAAIYLRSIFYIQIPIALLSIGDSSTGGKTAIDLPARKNLVGALYQPALVLCDISTVDTLPTIEVHISDVGSHESFRQISYTGLACEKTIKGKGLDGYVEAILYLVNRNK